MWEKLVDQFHRAFSVFLCLLMSALPAISADQQAGQINALIPAATRNAQAAKAKDALQWNDLLKTEQAGRMRASLTDGSILSLGSNSELRVVQHDATSQQTSLEVGYGKLRSRVVKVTQPNGKFEVKTPNAVIGVIGTDFFVGYEPNKTTVICYTGVVTVTPIGNAKIVKNSGDNSENNITLNAGQMVVISDTIPPAGFQPEPAPQSIVQASMTDTNVPDAPPAVAKASSHLVRNVILGVGVAAAGWAIGYTQLKQDPPAPAPPRGQCPPQSPKC
jgi:hypothetical protein